MIKKITCFLVISYLFFGFISPISANQLDNVIKQAQDLLAQNKPKQAFDLLSPVADDYAGNAEFDYIFGLILLQLKHNTLAVLALERAFMMRPEHLQTQLSLVEAYQRLNNVEMAEQLLEQIKQQPKYKVTTKIETKKTQEFNIDYNFSGFLGAALGYDDNLTNGPNDNKIELPVVSHLGPIFVGDTLEKDQDFFSSVNAGGVINLIFPYTFGLNAGFYGNRRNNDTREDEDTSLFSAWLGGSYQWGENKFNLTFQQQNIWLNDEDYNNQYSVLGQWARSFYSSSLLTLYAEGKISRYPNAKNIDADSYILGSVFYQQFNTFFSPLLSVELYGGENQISDSGYSYLGFANIGMRFGSRFIISANDFFYLNTGFEHRRYKEENPFFLTTRDDRRYSVNGIYTHYLFNRQLALSVQGTWQLNESSVELYDYQRNFATLSFQWNF